MPEKAENKPLNLGQLLGKLGTELANVPDANKLY
jgi:hypothetical protein